MTVLICAIAFGLLAAAYCLTWALCAIAAQADDAIERYYADRQPNLTRPAEIRQDTIQPPVIGRGV